MSLKEVSGIKFASSKIGVSLNSLIAKASLAVLVLLSVLFQSPVQAAICIGTDCSYPSIQTAIDAATSGQTITVDAGIYSENISFGPANITLQGAGAGSTIIQGASSTTYQRVVTFSSASTTSATVIDGFTISNLSSGFGGAGETGGVYITGGASPTLSNMTITGNDQINDATAHMGAGIRISDGGATIINSNITDNFGDTYGGGLYASTSNAGDSLTINNSNISNNIVDGGGGGAGIMAQNYAGTITITATNIDSNTIPSAYLGKAGGVWCDNCANMQLIDVNITNNSTNRTSSGDIGGGIVVTSGGNITMTGGSVHSNRAQKGAAGIYVSDVGSNFSGNRCSVKGNVTYGDDTHGGGFRIDSGATVTLTNCMISGNSTANRLWEYGGGFYVNGGTLNLNHSTVAGNYGHRSGGGIYIDSGSATIVGSLIWGNTSSVTPAESDLQGNAAVSYSAIQNGAAYTSGTGTISAISGTVFVGPDPAGADVGKTSGDYRLKTDAVEAINTADPGSSVNEDFYGGARPVAARNDMGAHESGATGGVIIAGTVYSDEGSTPVGNGVQVRLLVNGGSPLSTTTTAGAYSFTASPNAGHTLTVHIDNDASYSGTTVTISDSNALTNLDIYDKHLITRFDNSTGSLSNADLATADDGDTDILYTITNNNLTVEGTDTELYIWGGDSYAPGGNIDTINMDIVGILDAGTNAINVSGHWDVDAIASFISTGTVTFDANSGTVNIITGGTDANHDFNNVIFDDGGGTATFMLQGALMVTNNFRLNDGILDTNDTADYAITVGNDFDQPTGQIQANDSVLTTGGNFNVEGTESSTGYNRASIVLNGSGALVTYNLLNNPAVNGFYNLSVGQAGAADSLTNALAVRNQLSVGSGSFSGSLGIYLSGNGDVLSFDPAANLAIDALRFMGASPNIPALINGYASDIYVQGDNTTVSQTGAVTLQAGQRLYVHGNDGQKNLTATYDTAGFELNVGGSIEVGAGTDTGLKTLNMSNSIVSVAGDFNIQPGPVQAQISASGSTVTFNGTTNQQLTSSGNTFNNITLNNTGASGSDKLTFTDTLDIDGSVVINNGNFDITVNDPAVTIAGNLDIGTNGTINTTGRSNKLLFDGTSILNDASSAGPQDLGDVELNGTSLTLASDTFVETMTVTTGTLDLGNGGYVFEIDGIGTPFANLGSFDAGTSTVKYSGTGTATNITALAYDNLQLSPTAATNYALLGHIVMTGNLDIGSNATLDVSGSPSAYNLSANDITINGTYIAQDSTIQASGNWTNNGTFTANTSSVELTGTNQAISGANTFNNLSKTVSSAATLTFEAGVTQTINGVVTLQGIANQRLTLASSDAGTTPWNFNVTASATKAIDYVSVSWSDASLSAPAQRPIEPSNAIDGGDTLEWFGTPIITVEKSSTVVSDLINGTSNPKRIPGAVVRYDITVTNSGTGAPDLDSIFITDLIDTSTVEFDFDSGITFTDGSPASTLTLGSVVYSSDGGTSYSYSPTGPYDPNITHVKILASGTFAYGATPANNFTLSYNVRVK